MQEDKLKGAALMVVANKQDVVNSMGADEIADVELLSLPWPFETHPFSPSILCPLSYSLFPLPSLFVYSNHSQRGVQARTFSDLVFQHLSALNPK